MTKNVRAVTTGNTLFNIQALDGHDQTGLIHRNPRVGQSVRPGKCLLGGSDKSKPIRLGPTEWVLLADVARDGKMPASYTLVTLGANEDA